MATIVGQAFEVARDIVAADHVQHRLAAIAFGDALDLLDIVMGLVVDRMVRAPGERGGAFVVRSAGDDDGDAEQPAQRDRHGADAAGAAMDQYRIAIDRIGALEQIGPHGEQRFRQGRGFDHVVAQRHRQALDRRSDRILGIAAARDQRADRLAHQRRIMVVAHRDDRAGHFQPRNRRGTGRWRIFARALQCVGAIDARRRDLDQHFAGARLRHRHAARPQDLRPARLHDVDRRHFTRNMYHSAPPAPCDRPACCITNAA